MRVDKVHIYQCMIMYGGSVIAHAVIYCPTEQHQVLKAYPMRYPVHARLNVTRVTNSKLGRAGGLGLLSRSGCE